MNETGCDFQIVFNMLSWRNALSTTEVRMCHKPEWFSAICLHLWLSIQKQLLDDGIWDLQSIKFCLTISLKQLIERIISKMACLSLNTQWREIIRFLIQDKKNELASSPRGISTTSFWFFKILYLHRVYIYFLISISLWTNYLLSLLWHIGHLF